MVRGYNVPMAIIRAASIRLDRLQQYHRNPRVGDVAAIRGSMERLGQYKPIVVNVGSNTGRANEILAGNHTYQAAQQLGMETIQAVFVDVDEATGERIMLADNRTSDLATYDHDELMGILADLPDLAGTGYTADQVQVIEPAAPETVEQPNKSQEGVNLFNQRKDWETRETRGILLDYNVDEYWQVRDMFDTATKRAGTATPAETLLYLVEQATGEKAPRA